MAWITIMVVAFIIATTCLLSKLIDYKMKRHDQGLVYKKDITAHVNQEIEKARKKIQEAHMNSCINK